MHTPLSPPQPAQWKLSDGYVARGRIWSPPHALGTILYLHGIQSHGGWYEWSASLLAACGWHVVLPDRRGSGLNEQARGDAPNIDRWLRDIDEIASATIDRAVQTPARLIGLSWGGKVATALALRDPQRWQQLLLITPGVFPAVDVGFWQRMRIGRALLTHPTTPFEIPLSDPALFTDNPLGQHFIARDALKLTHATARFLFHSSRLARRLRRVAHGALQVPTMLLLAGKEQIICNDPTERWLRRIAVAEPRVVRFESDAHTLEFSAAPGAYERFLRDWAKV